MASTLLPTGLVVLRAPAGCGKSTFAEQLANDAGVADAIVSTDAIRAELCGDAGDQSANAQVFTVRDQRVAARLRAGLPTIADSTHLRPASITGLVELARRADVPVSVVDCSVDLEEALRRNAARDRVVPEDAVRSHFEAHAAHDLGEFLDAGADVAVHCSDVIGWAPNGVNGSHLRGPFDIIGDVHGQYDTLTELIEALGYDEFLVHPDGRIPVFVGDLVDKGPESVRTLEAIMAAHRRGRALVVRGNHEHKLARRLAQVDAEASTAKQRRELLAVHGEHGTDPRVSVFMELIDDERCETGFGDIVRWITRLPTQLVLDGGRLVVVHSAIRTEDVGRVDYPSNRTRQRAEGWNLYGPSTGRKDPETGLPERIDWIPEWDRSTFVVRGHVTVPVPEIRNGVASTDIGAGDGIALAALHWPEKDFTSVPVRDVARV